jgi:hypothetical protein
MVQALVVLILLHNDPARYPTVISDHVNACAVGIKQVEDLAGELEARASGAKLSACASLILFPSTASKTRCGTSSALSSETIEARRCGVRVRLTT